MLFIFFWKVMSWIFCTAFPFVILMSQNLENLENLYLEKHALSCIWKMFTVLGTKIAQKDWACATRIPC